MDVRARAPWTGVCVSEKDCAGSEPSSRRAQTRLIEIATQRNGVDSAVLLQQLHQVHIGGPTLKLGIIRNANAPMAAWSVSAELPADALA